ncbi:hypothetical protein COY95_01105 [Candidatus Woesearchaeota archaeon CG_4_10_14_0_8_um_filter_47_5]|nr:MAG: hypothetical protein COY95_01105 [Candidatus Woesearchaeota archaeon CG_4_10_14_0_8_um_filter_47_5]
MDVKLKYIMAKLVIALSVERFVIELAHTMVKTNVSCVVALKNNKPAGIVTERDLAKLIVQNKDPKTTTIGEVMTSPILTLSEDSTMLDAIDLFTTKRIRHVIVVRDGAAVGIVTETDIVREQCLGRGDQ